MGRHTLRRESLYQGVEGCLERWPSRHEGSYRHAFSSYPPKNVLVAQSFFKEVVIWKRLRHPNVVSFIGVTMEPLQIVSEWIPNGTLTQYVKNNPGASRIGLVSVSSGIVLD